ncbi:MAG: hypothetical protein DRR42_21070 [Gammaproteobacteria bacterium]|nr:MAG: hypothetical protein DRR42_21070 [Gammaproteobacteria bacterium]
MDNRVEITEQDEKLNYSHGEYIVDLDACSVTMPTDRAENLIRVLLPKGITHEQMSYHRLEIERLLSLIWQARCGKLPNIRTPFEIRQEVDILTGHLIEVIQNFGSRYNTL